MDNPKLVEGMDDAQAEQALREVLMVDPRDVDALRLLDALYERTDRSVLLAGVLEARIDLETQPDDRARLCARLGLLKLRRGDAAGAHADLARGVTEAGHLPELRRATEALLEHARTRGAPPVPAAAQLVESVLRAQNDLAAVPQMVELRLAGEKDPEVRAVTLLDVAQIQESLGQPELGFMTLCRALKELPTDEGLRGEAERLAQATDNLEGLALVYEDMLEDVQDAPTRAALLRRVAELGEQTGAAPDAVREKLAAAVEAGADDIPTLQTLVRVSRQQGEPRALSRALGRLAAAAERDKRQDILRAACTERLEVDEAAGNIDEAIATARMLFAKDPTDQATVSALERLLQRAKRWDDLDDLLAHAADSAPVREERAQVFARLAFLRLEHRGDPAAALEAIRGLAEASPQAEALAALGMRLLLSVASDHRPEVPSWRAEVAELLDPRLEGAGSWNDLVAVLRIKLDVNRDPASRRALYLRIVDVEERLLERPEQAMLTLARALGENPGDGELRDRAERLSVKLHDLESLLGVYEDILETMAREDPLRFVYAVRAAELYEGGLGQPLKATEFYQLALKAADAGGASQEQQQRLVERVETLLRAVSSYSQLAAVLKQKAKLEPDAQVARRTLFEAATVELHKAKDFKAASETLGAILEADPSDVQAVRALGEASEELERWDVVAEMLERELSLIGSSDPARIVKVRFRLGVTLDRHLARPDAALEHLQAILKEAPDHRETREYLESRLAQRQTGKFDSAVFLTESYERTGDWKRAVEVLQGQLPDLERRGESKEIHSLLMRIATIQEQNLQNPGLAFATLCRALKNQPHEHALRTRLNALASANELADELVDIYEDEATTHESEGNAELAADMREAAAALCAGPLDALDRAMRIHESILERQPGRASSLEALTRLYEQAGQFAELEKMLRRRLVFEDEAATRFPLLVSLADCLVDKLGRAEDAHALLEEARRYDPANATVRRLMIDVGDALGNVEDLRRLLTEEVEACTTNGDTAHLTQAKQRLAVLLADEINDVPAAIPLWEELRAQDVAKGNTSARDVSFKTLERLYTAASRYADLRQLYEQALRGERDPALLSSLTTKLGEVLSVHLGGKEEATARHLKILELDPQNASSLQALRGLLADLGRYDELVAHLRKMMRGATQPEQQKELRFELAEVLGAKLAKRAESAEAGRRLLELEPHSPAELDRLAGIFRVNDAWDELVDVLERAIRATDGDTRLNKLAELSRVYEEKVRRLDLAPGPYERVLKLAPGNDVAYAQLSRLYTELKDWQKLAAVKDDRAKRAKTAADRIALLREVGALYEDRLGQKPLAFLAACRAFREDWEDADLGAWAERLALETDSIDEMVSIYDDALGNLTDGRRIIDTHVRIAELSWRHLGASADAEVHYRRALDAEPNNQGAFDGLVALLESQQKWPEIVKMFERQLEQAPASESRVALLLRLALILDEKAGDVDGAVRAYGRVLELAPAHAETLRDFAALLERTGRWHELIEVLKRQQTVAPTSEDRLAVRLRIAGLWDQRLQDPEQAIAAYQSVLEENPASLPALNALDALFSAQRRPRELVETLETLVDLSASAGESVPLLFRIAETWERDLSDLAQAVRACVRILKVDRQNLRAVEGLERLYAAQKEWAKLVEAYAMHLALNPDPRERVRLYIAIGNVEAQELGRVPKAEAAFKAALDIDKTSQDAVHALGSLYEKQGSWDEALERLRAEVLLLGTSRESVAVHHRIGSIYEHELHDAASATNAYRTAVEVDPAHLPSLRALKGLALARGDHAEHLHWIREEARHTPDPLARTELHTAAGVFLSQTMEDAVQAVAAFEQALAITYDHMPAVKPLAELCFAEGSWERTEQLLDIIVDRLNTGADAHELCRQHYRLGYVCEKLGREPKALVNYQRAHELDATYLPVLESLGAALSRASRWEDAARVYQAILLNHRSGLTDAEVVDYHQQVADLQHKTGQNDRAIKSLEKALELDPGHPPSLRLLALIYMSDRRSEDAYEVYVRLVPLLFGDDRVQVLIETGRMAAADLEDPYRAIDAYEDANRQRPNDKLILESLFQLYRQTRQAGRAVDMLEELVRLEQDEKARVRLNHTLGEVYRDELKNDQRALAYFNAALDLDPNYVKSFEAIEAMLTASGSWEALAENYIAMLKRIPETRAGIKGVLWKNLGDLYRFRLRNLEGATQAYRVIVRMSPDNADATEVLAELLSKNAATLDEAFAGFQRVAQLVPDKLPKVLHDLLRISLARQATDRVYIYASILKVLGQATPQELELLSLYQKQVPPQAKRKMSDKLWEALLVHPQARGHVALLSATLWRSAGAAVALQPRDFGIDKRRGSDWEQVDLEAPVQSYFVNQLKHVRGVLDTGPFDLFQKANSTDPLTPLCLAQPTLALGKASPLLADTQARRLWFSIARQLTSLRPAYMLPRTMGAVRFGTLVDVAAKVVDPRYPVRGDPAEVARFEKALALGGPTLQGALRPAVAELLKARQAINVNPFLEGMEHTSIRAGYLLTGDLELCLELLKQPDPGAVRLAHTVKVKELLLFAVSDEHFELRQRLGLAIGS